jgi:nitrogen fixation/metabolism regulation signal transduction histidine kinase
MSAPRRARGTSFERRILIRALAIALPGTLVALALLWTGDYSAKLRLTLTALLVVLGGGLAFSLRARIVHPLQTISNLVAALREGDFSIRARGARRDDALGETMIELNAMTESLRHERLDALEASALLRTIMGEIDVAVFAFDAARTLRLVNRAGERLLARPAEQLIGRDASTLGLEACLREDAPLVMAHTFPAAAGRWEARRTTFRQGGLPLQLLVVTNLSRVLREEERQTWQRLIRVIGHELNNSLAPIRSIAGSLEALLAREPRPADWESDMLRGLAVIGARSAALSRFMDAYASLAGLPRPERKPAELGPLLRRVVGLETRLAVELSPGPEVVVRVDGDQIEQALINLVRNAVDASLETGGRVEVGWTLDTRQVEVWVLDRGPGLSNTSNLFVPFFTTKSNGSGIGLVLSRQIAENHGGELVVANRADGPGVMARMCLPL